ncbi:MAG: hypothetical protein ABII96_05725, partial [Candidatus Zixiibacteriota bacterium]
TMKLTVDEKKLYQLVKKALSEVMEENLKKLKLGLIPYVPDEEMKEIEEIFGTPEKYKKQEFIKQDL